MTSQNPFRRRRRRATMAMAGVLVVASIVASLVLWQGVAALRRYEAARNVTRTAIDVPKSWTGLWATVDAEDRLGSLTAVVGMPGGGNGGHLISIPTNGDGSGQDAARSFRTAFADGGLDQLQFAVEAALYVTFDFVQVSAPADFVALIGPASPAEVTLETPISSATPPLKAGTASLSGDQLAQVMNVRDDNADEAAHSANVQAAWKGVVAALGTGRTNADPALAPTTFAELLNHVMAGSVDSTMLRTHPFPAVRELAEEGVEMIDLAGSVMVFASVAPSNVSAPSPGLIYRVEAPPGNERRVFDAVGILLFVGFNVTQVSLAGPELETTRIFLADSRDRDISAKEDPLFGAVEYTTEGQRILGIDVVLSLGYSYLSKPPEDHSLPASDSTPDSTHVTTTSEGGDG